MSPKISYNNCNCKKIDDNNLPSIKLKKSTNSSKVTSFYTKPKKLNKNSLF